MYLEHHKKNMYDYIIINQELWTFFFERYGGYELKRYFVRKNQMNL